MIIVAFHRLCTNLHIEQFRMQNRFTFIWHIALIKCILHSNPLYTFQKGQTSGAIAILCSRKEFGGDDGIAINKRLARIPLLNPIEKIRIYTRRTSISLLGFGPYEGKFVGSARDNNWNLHLTVISKRSRVGRNCKCYGLIGIID